MKKLSIGLVVLLSIVLFCLSSSNFAVAAEGVTKDTIKIGSIIALSGPRGAGIVGRYMDFAHRAYFNYINDQGGINGRKIEYYIQDDQYDPAKTPIAARELVENKKVFLLFDTLGTSPALAIIPYLEKRKVPRFAAYANIPKINQYKYQFTVLPTSVSEAKVIADFVVHELKAKRVALEYQIGALGKATKKSLSEQLKKYNLNLVEEVGHNSGAVDLSAQAQKLRAANPDVVVAGHAPKEIASLLKEMEKIGWKPAKGYVFTTALHGAPFLKLAGTAAEGSYASKWYETIGYDHPNVKLYKSLLNKYFPDQTPSDFGIMAFGAAILLVEGLKEAGRDLTRDSFIRTIEEWKNKETGLLPPVSFGPGKRQGTLKVGIDQIKGGQFISVWDWRLPK